MDRFRIINPGFAQRVSYVVNMLATMVTLQSLLSVFTSFGKIVELVSRVFSNTYQFIIYYLLWLTAQTVILIILGVEIEEPEYKFGEDGKVGADFTYEQLHTFWIYWLWNF